MKLVDVVTAYITLQQSLGLRFQSGGRLLRRFARLMGDIPIDAVRPESVAAFLQGAGALSTSWQLRHVILSGFYRFAISRGYVALSPLPVSRPQLPRSQSPYVYSTGELRRLIAATSVLYVGHSRLQSSMFRVLILLLYGSGLRIGEALGLTMADVDLGERVIAVRQTKFFKYAVPIAMSM